jgi:hypothetical protein
VAERAAVLAELWTYGTPHLRRLSRLAVSSE